MMASRGIFALLGLACLLAAVMALRPGWLVPQPDPPARRPGIELVHPPDARLELLARRREFKAEVVLRLLDGNLTLVEAAGRFRRLNTSPPGVEDVSWKSQPGADDGERLCNQVIVWASVELDRTHTPSEAAARVAALSRELHDHVARHGGVQLPEAGAE
jgi:hypothetical protein